MNKRDTVLALLALSVAPLGSFAQQPSRVWRIGILETTSVALNAATMKLAENMMNTAVRGALKGTKI